MKKTLFLATFFLISELFGVSGFLYAANQENYIEQDKATLMSSVWMPDEKTTLVCKISQSQSMSFAELTIIDFDHKTGRSKFSTAPGDSPLSLFVTSDLHPKLVTVWTTGSAYVIRVYAYNNGEIVEVLSAGSRMMPEFVYATTIPLKNDQQIVISNSEWRQNKKSGTVELKAVSADIYEWNGRTYLVRKNIPWGHRLKK